MPTNVTDRPRSRPLLGPVSPVQTGVPVSAVSVRPHAWQGWAAGIKSANSSDLSRHPLQHACAQMPALRKSAVHPIWMIPPAQAECLLPLNAHLGRTLHAFSGHTRTDSFHGYRRYKYLLAVYLQFLCSQHTQKQKRNSERKALYKTQL